MATTRRKRRIGILTGGGDVPGLNSVIREVVYGATEPGRGFDLVGIRHGWKGLTHVDVGGQSHDDIIALDRQNTRVIDRTGGTFLHSSRTNPAEMSTHGLPNHLQKRLGECREVRPGHLDMTRVVLDNLEALRIDYLLVIGGDDTLSYASRLDAEGFPTVAVPKTMDNDVRNTEYCIGFSTAMTRAMQTITDLRTTLGSHERVGVFRIFGRDAGFTALYAAYVTNVRCCIPELEFPFEPLATLLAEDKQQNPSHYAIVLLSEGATWQGRPLSEHGKPDAFGHKKKVNIAEDFASRLQHDTGLEPLVADLTYELRSGAPDFFDRMIGTSFATMACQCILDGAHGRMMALRNGCFTDTDIPDPALGPRQVDVETMYDTDRFRPRYGSKNGLPVFMLRE